MPSENRRLVFSREELADAITNYSFGPELDLPSGEVILCRVRGDAGLYVTTKLLPEGESDLQTVQLTPEIVGAALTQYCIDQRIPMPRNAEKTLEAVGDNIAMNFTIGIVASPLPELL